MPMTDSELLALLQAWYWPFLRVSALLLAAPIFGAGSVPVRARVLLGVLVAALLAPSLPATPAVDVVSPAGILLAAQQLLIGLAMGFVLQMAFAAIVIAGQSLAMTMGLGFAMSVDPQNGVQVPVLSQLYVILATLIFLAIDGHLVLIRLVADSFATLPVGAAPTGGELALGVVLWAGQMFACALLLALPALSAVLLVNISFGVITRAAPQLNIFAVGFPVTITVGFAFILLSMSSMVSVLQGFFDDSLAQALQLLR
ncbi:MAG: flagellar biosynthetic protein FliR [Halioglobus sp.]|nr:flagellar biosynthetic protein FliR [Halioglobus sp.]